MLCLRDRFYRQSWIVNPISSRKLVRTALLGHRSLEYWLEVDDCLGDTLTQVELPLIM